MAEDQTLHGTSTRPPSASVWHALVHARAMAEAGGSVSPPPTPIAAAAPAEGRTPVRRTAVAWHRLRGVSIGRLAAARALATLTRARGESAGGGANAVSDAA